MNLADQFKNVNWKDIGNAPALPKMLAMVLLLIADIFGNAGALPMSFQLTFLN